MARPANTDHPEPFAKYVNQVPEDDIHLAIKNQFQLINNFLQSITEERSKYSYAPGKWTIKEVLQHLIDAERVFAYRAICIARKEEASLPSFDENSYAANSNANARSWQSLCDECLNLRKSTVNLIESFTEEMFLYRGLSGGKTVNVLSLAFIIAGHFYHHIRVVKEKYI